MAFDLYAGETHERIDHHEEFLFLLVEGNEDRYPTLAGLWQAFYESPRLTSQQAAAIMHELLDLLVSNGGTDNRALAVVAVRLMAFFSNAYRECLDVTCCSD